MGGEGGKIWKWKEMVREWKEKVERYGNGRRRMEKYGNRRRSMEKYGNGRGRMDKYGNERGKVEKNGNERGKVEKYGYERGKVEKYGNGRKRMEKYGKGRKRIEKYGNGRRRMSKITKNIKMKDSKLSKVRDTTRVEECRIHKNFKSMFMGCSRVVVNIKVLVPPPSLVVQFSFVVE